MSTNKTLSFVLVLTIFNAFVFFFCLFSVFFLQANTRRPCSTIRAATATVSIAAFVACCWASSPAACSIGMWVRRRLRQWPHYCCCHQGNCHMQQHQHQQHQLQQHRVPAPATAAAAALKVGWPWCSVWDEGMQLDFNQRVLQVLVIMDMMLIEL